MEVRVEEARRYCFEAFVAMGATAEQATILTEVLHEADLRGHLDHGSSVVALFWPDVREGTVRIRPTITVSNETPVSVLVDGDGGFGAIAASRAMDECIDRARAIGIGVAAVRNSSHTFYPGYYALHAAEAGFVGFFTTTSRPTLAPIGAAERVLGQNPICYGIPAANHPPILLDVGMAASIAKIRIARNEARSIPAGWALDREGNPTTDAAAAMTGLLVPIGEHKGFGLALVMDALIGLGGAPAGKEAGPHGAVGHFLWALDPRIFGSTADFSARIDGLLDQVLGAPLLPGRPPATYPGAGGAARKAETLARGILDLPETVVRAMDQTARELGIRSPIE
ncbi:MAG TPA: Ldh family oxidoreductase [Chloroflexota bacterium]|nr:Ldh family oxidoreductase [Chloroflexota bacterium]